MKFLGRKTSFGFSRRRNSEPKSSSENSDKASEPIAAPAQHVATASSSPVNSRRNSLKEAWASIKKVVKKSTSLPEFFNRRNTSPSPSTPPVPQTLPSSSTPKGLFLAKIPTYREIELRRRDEEDSRFGNCIIGLMHRCPKYYYLLDRQTREKLVREGKADPSIYPEGIVKNTDENTDKSNKCSNEESSESENSSESGNDVNSTKESAEGSTREKDDDETTLRDPSD